MALDCGAGTALVQAAMLDNPVEALSLPPGAFQNPLKRPRHSQTRSLRDARFSPPRSLMMKPRHLHQRLSDQTNWPIHIKVGHAGNLGKLRDGGVQTRHSLVIPQASDRDD